MKSNSTPGQLLILSALVAGMVCASPLMAAPVKESAGNPKSIQLNDQGIQALEQNNGKVAEELFRKSLALDAGNLTAAFNLAGVLVVNHKKDEALTLLADYTKKFPVDAGLYSRYGDLLFSSGKIKEAVENYEKAFAIDKKYVRLTERMGLSYALLNRLDESEQMYLAAVAGSPKDAELLGNLSSVLLSNGKPEKAAATAKESIRLSPKSEVYVTLGSAFEAQRDLKGALSAYRRAREMGAESEELTNKIVELEKAAS